MKKILFVTLGVMLAWGEAGAAAAKIKHGRRGGSDIVSIGQSASLKEGETAEGMVVIGGSAVVEGEVDGDVVVIGGNADVSSAVDGDLVVFGSAKLGPKASVGGDTVVIGGSLDADPAADIRGEKTLISLRGIMPFAGGVWRWVTLGLMKARALPLEVWWVWALALTFGFIYVLLAAGAPGAVEACAKTLTERPVSALLAGILGLSGLAPFAFLLAVSIAGIAVIPLLILAALAATVVGKAALCRVMGAKSGKFSPMAATALGAVELLALYAVPVLGLAAWALSTVFGFGAALLAGVEALKGEAGEAKASVEDKPEAEAALASSVADDAALPRADFALKLAAFAFDGFAFFVICGIMPFVAVGLGGWALYQVGMWSWKGTTLGGMIVGIKGVRLDGRPMDVTVALVRHLASYLSALPMFLGFFWAGWDRDGQSWHDKIAGTVVVRIAKVQAAAKTA